MPRPKQTLARPPGKRRDARLFVVATEDTFAPRQYFRFFEHERLIVQVLHAEDGFSSPGHVVQKLVDYERDYQLKEDDQLWALLDTDHWIEPGHKKGLLDAIGGARQRGFRVAMSNPCFDLWLLLHHEAVAPGTAFSSGDAVGARIRSLLGEYNKINLKPEHYPKATVGLPGRFIVASLCPELLRPGFGQSEIVESGGAVGRQESGGARCKAAWPTIMMLARSCLSDHCSNLTFSYAASNCSVIQAAT